MKQKVVLAFSGGLDTSFCQRTVFDSRKRPGGAHRHHVNTGGFPKKKPNVSKNVHYNWVQPRIPASMP